MGGQRSSPPPLKSEKNYTIGTSVLDTRWDYGNDHVGQYAILATVKACGYFCSFHQMTPTVRGRTHYLFIDP